MRNLKALPTLVYALLAMTAVLVLPQTAGAGSKQLSLLQDDAELFGDRGEDPVAAMREMRDLGVDVIRSNVLFYRVYTRPGERTKPAGFDTSNPNNSIYNWAPTDRIVNLARASGMKVLLTVTGPGPHWASEQPKRCKSVPCTWKPRASEFGAFTAAVAKRYRGKVDWYSLYNEPNLKTWITPQTPQRTKYGSVDTAGIYYRQLWTAGNKSIAQFDPAHRGKVLFGEVAAIGEPIPTLYTALCLDPSGNAFRGRLRTLHKCPKRPAKLPIGGYAIHPYNQGGFGPPRRKTTSKTALPQQYLPRLHKLMNRAAGKKRTPGGRGIYITEFGYQTNPPDSSSTVTPGQHAQYINESDRLFFGDSRVKTVAQYQLVDVRNEGEYNSGLRFAGGAKKPAYDSYRMPIVITKKSSKAVEVYGQVRPARVSRTLFGTIERPELQFARSGGSFSTVARPSLNSFGTFRINQRRSGAASGRWRIKWANPLTGTVSYSRVAKAAKKLAYYRN
jgi:hypothetical protein